MEQYFKSNYRFLIHCILFLIPVNIYLIGDGAAAGVRWVLFRYQQSYLGNSLILFTKDPLYIQAGVLAGKSAVAAGMAFTASSLFTLAAVLLAVGFWKKKARGVRISAVITIVSGSLFLLSDIIQYGILLHGPAGFVIPIGVPVIILAGALAYRMDPVFPDEDEKDTIESEPGKEETA